METKTETPKRARINVYGMVSGKIIEQLEKGVIPWLKSVAELPKNFITQKPYRSVNVLLLTAIDCKQPYFLSANQLKELGGTVKENEKPTPVVYWKKPEEENKKPVLRYLNLYNIAQTEGIPEDKFPVAVQKDKIELCKKIVRNMPNKPEIVQNSETSFYSAKMDYIAMQPTHLFQNPEEYYSELFRLLVFCTGTEKRLARKEYKDFYMLPDPKLTTEELIVQIGTFILKTHCGIKGGKAENTAHSVLAWQNILQGDKKLIVYAASRAQQAVDYILNTKPDTVAKEDTL